MHMVTLFLAVVVGGMKIGRGNRSTRIKPAPAPICPQKIPQSDPSSNSGRRGGKPATNGVSYGAALLHVNHSTVYCENVLVVFPPTDIGK
jgi:hypothetical protein